MSKNNGMFLWVSVFLHSNIILVWAGSTCYGWQNWKIENKIHEVHITQFYFITTISYGKTM